MISRRWLDSRVWALSALLAFGLAPAAHAAGDPESCEDVHFADVGWSDVTATTSDRKSTRLNSSH